LHHLHQEKDEKIESEFIALPQELQVQQIQYAARKQDKEYHADKEQLK